MTDRDKTKIVPFNSLPFEERNRISYYMEEYRALGMRQIGERLKNDIGKNQKAIITKWINNIETRLKRDYEVIE